MPKSLWKRKRGVQRYLGAVEPLPCVLKINHTLDFPTAPSAIPHLHYPEATSLVPRAQPASSGSRRPASSAPQGTRDPREVPACAAIPASRSSDSARGERNTMETRKGQCHSRTPVPCVAAPTTRGDALSRLCLAFPENTNFIIDLCSFVIFITWPALLLKAVTNLTSPGWKGRETLTLSGRALPTYSPLADGIPRCSAGEQAGLSRGAGRAQGEAIWAVLGFAALWPWHTPPLGVQQTERVTTLPSDSHKHLHINSF